MGGLQGHVDVLSSRSISGWVHDPSEPGRSLAVAISVNDDRIAQVKACLFRDDLWKLGYGDGRKGFAFDPSSYLRPGENHVRVCYGDTNETVTNGDRTILHVDGLDSAQHAESDLLELSQVRWKGDEAESSLTWGSMMTGDSFLDVVERHHPFRGDETLLEIGPGYGRLLRTMKERRLPFARYVGLDISAARAARLTHDLGTPHVEFVHGDILKDRIEARPDLVLCSSTFEHLFPSIGRALRNLRAMATPRTQLFVDFIHCEGDDDLRVSRAYFESTTAYIRIYARADLEHLFSEAGFRVVAIERIVLGQDRAGKDVRRALVVAESR